MARLSSLLIFTVLVSALIDATLASSWLFGSNKLYNEWHKTELERWLDDHDIPYPAAADRKDLADTVSKHWSKVSQAVYETWDESRLRVWLEQRAVEFDVNAKKEALVGLVKANWYGYKAEIETSWENVKDWVFDSWSESQLKAFLDKHRIPYPQSGTRNALLTTARESYERIKKSVGETAAIPGNWLYEVWSDSELKSWCDYRGIPVPQGSKRNELIALVRRNMRKAKFQGKEAYLVGLSSASSLGSVAYDSAKNLLTEATDAASSITSKYGAQATSYASHLKDEAFEEAISSWSESRLKSYLEERDVPVPHISDLDELRALVCLNAHKAKTHAGFLDATFDTWSSEQLQQFIGEKAKGTRDELIAQAKEQYTSASAKGGEAWHSFTAKGAKATGNLFDRWSDSDLKALLDTYGVPVTQDTKREELLVAAKLHSRYFSQGPDWYTRDWIKQLNTYINQGADYVKNFISGASGLMYSAREKLGYAAKEEATIEKHRVQEAMKKAEDRVYEKGQQEYDKVKEEL